MKMNRSTPISRWIFDEYQVRPESLGIGRIIFASSLLLMGYPRYLWLGKFPDSFYVPPLGLGLLFRGQPPLIVLWGLFFLAMVLTIGLLLGWRTRFSGLALAAVTLVGNSFEYSFGKIDHDILIFSTLVTMSFSDWGNRFSIDQIRRRPEDQNSYWAGAMLAMVIGLGMFSAFLPKLSGGWLNPSVSSSEGHLIYNFVISEHRTWLGQAMIDHLPLLGWKFLDWSTMIIEISFLFAMFSRQAMRWVCAAAVFFHAGIDFSMDIFFYPSLLAYAMFVDWDWLLEYSVFRKSLGFFTKILCRLNGFSILIFGGGLTLLYGCTGNPAIRLFGRRNVEVALTVVSCVLCIFCIAAGLRRWWRSRSSDTPLILFDGTCGLCDRWVSFVLSHDRNGNFRFAALQSESGRAALERCKLPPDYVDSIVMARGTRATRYSTAVLETLRELPTPWSFAYACILVPPVIRDWIYDA